jgi:hypothetical protein
MQLLHRFCTGLPPTRKYLASYRAQAQRSTLRQRPADRARSRNHRKSKNIWRAQKLAPGPMAGRRVPSFRSRDLRTRSGEGKQGLGQAQRVRVGGAALRYSSRHATCAPMRSIRSMSTRML